MTIALPDPAPARSPSCEGIRPSSTTDEMPFRRFVCQVCGHSYDEAEGDPAAGIAPGTRWDDIPATWSCPDCGATKADFLLTAA
jgi:rubredoxin